MELRLLTLNDMAAVLRLRDLAGWNQTERDIRRLLALEPEGCFAACIDGQVVGTTTTTTYGNELAWIGMVLVDPSHRRRGIATELMKRAMAYLRDRGVTTIKLDATPAGRPVYERFGFEVECSLERWTGRVPGTSSPVKSGNWNDIAAVDRAAFGICREALMRSLIADSGPPIVARNNDGEVTGFASTRPGSRAAYIGPVIAPDIETARSLLSASLATVSDEQALIDIHLDFAGATNLLSDLGFARSRELLRMRLGPNASVGRSLRVFAIAGPEVG